MSNKTDPYASAEETRALIVPDTRTAAERKLDQMLEERGASEQGAEPALILRQIAVELMAEQPAQQEPGRNHWEDGDVFERIAARATPQPAPSQYGSPELQAMIVARAMEKNAAEQPAQQEPVAWMYDWICDGKRIEGWIAHKESEIPRSLASNIRPLYTSPPAQRTWVSLTDEWVPVTQSLLNEQHPWLYQPMWIAMKDGNVFQGYYEWRQGQNPDRFYTTGDGDEWAFDAAYVMPIVEPTPPTIEAAHGIKAAA